LTVDSSSSRERASVSRLQLGAAQPAAGGAFGAVEHLADLLGGELLPVTQLEHQLRVQGEPAQGLEQQPLLALLADHGADANTQIRDGGLAEWRLAAALAGLLLEPLAQDVACNREQPGPHRRVIAESDQALGGADEAALHQILDLLDAADLVGEESI
jgi:hypothetical protein